jgi:hypothetical protein
MIQTIKKQALVLSILAVVAVGCSGSSDSSSGPNAAPTTAPSNPQAEAAMKKGFGVTHIGHNPAAGTPLAPASK